MTVLYTRWRFDNYIQDQEPNYYYNFFFFEKKIVKLSYIVQKNFHFDHGFIEYSSRDKAQNDILSPIPRNF